MKRALLFASLVAGAAACGGSVRDDASSRSVEPGGRSAVPGPGAGNAAGPNELARLDGEASSMTSDGTTLFVGMLDGRVLAVPQSGGAPVELVARGIARYPEGIAVDATFVYVSSLTQRNVGRVAKAGGAFEVMAEDLNRPYQVTLDASYVYFVDQGSVAVGGSANDGRVLRMAKTARAGDKLLELAAAQQSPERIAVDDANVYFANGPYGDTNGSIRAVPKAGGDVRVLARRLSTVHDLVLGADRAWFVDDDSHQLSYALLSGGDATAIATGGERVDPFGLASDGTSFFATTIDPSSNHTMLRSLGADGRAIATLADWTYDRGVMPISAIATIAGPTRVFWVDLESSGAFGVRSTIHWAQRP